MKKRNKEQKEQEVKSKKHFDPAKGAVRIVALLLAIMLIVAPCATLLFYLFYTMF